jgi:hypothetical protein
VRGFNRRDTPQSLPADIAVACDNVELLHGSLGRRRPTCTPVTLTSGPTEQIIQLFSHSVSTSSTSELWAVSGSASVNTHRRVAGTWSSVSLIDTPASSHVDAASLNNKFFLAYPSASNRLHVWDGTSVRRVGILASAAPSVADSAVAGAYAATARYYRIGWRIKVGAAVHATSELSAATSFTPNGAFTAAVVTKPTTPDSATHWVVYGLIGTAGDTYDLYEELSEIAVGTTTYSDTTAPASYDGDHPMPLGMNIPPPTAKYLLSDGNRLLMAGVWTTTGATGETTPVDDRVYFTRVLGTSDQGDDESIPNTADQKNWIDVGRNDGDTIRGLGGPVDGIVYVFKRRSIWRLVPTGIDVAPYRAERVTRSVGANTPAPVLGLEFNYRNIVIAENEHGQSQLYFVSTAGAYRISPAGGIEYVGWDVTSPSTGLGPNLWGGVFVPALRQIWWIEHTSGHVYVFTPQLATLTPQGWRGGWSRYSLGHLGGSGVECLAICMNDVTLDGSLTYPLIGANTSTTVGTIQAFTGYSTVDNATAFTASVTSAPLPLGDGAERVSCGSPLLEGAVQTGATPTVAYVLDYGRETRSGTTAALTAVGSETRKAVIAEAVDGADALAVQVKVTWDSDQSNVIDAVSVPYRTQEAA